MDREMTIWKFAPFIIAGSVILSIVGTGALRLWVVLEKGELADWSIVALLLFPPLILCICWWNETTIRKEHADRFHAEIKRLQDEIHSTRAKVPLPPSQTLDEVRADLRAYWESPF